LGCNSRNKYAQCSVSSSIIEINILVDIKMYTVSKFSFEATKNVSFSAVDVTITAHRKFKH